MKYRLLGACYAGGKSYIKGVGGLLAKSEHGWRPGRRVGGRECSVSPGGCTMSRWAWVCCTLAGAAARRGTALPSTGPHPIPPLVSLSFPAKPG